MTDHDHRPAHQNPPPESEAGTIYPCDGEPGDGLNLDRIAEEVVRKVAPSTSARTRSANR